MGAGPPDYFEPERGVVLTPLLIVRDVDRSREFYERVLEATVVRERGPYVLKFQNTPARSRPGRGADAARCRRADDGQSRSLRASDSATSSPDSRRADASDVPAGEAAMTPRCSRSPSKMSDHMAGRCNDVSELTADLSSVSTASHTASTWGRTSAMADRSSTSGSRLNSTNPRLSSWDG